MAFVPQGFTDSLLCARKCSRHQGHHQEPENAPALLGAGDLRHCPPRRMVVTKVERPPADSLPAGSRSNYPALGTWGHHLGTLVSHCPACPLPPPGNKLEPWTPAGTDSPSQFQAWGCPWPTQHAPGWELPEGWSLCLMGRSHSHQSSSPTVLGLSLDQTQHHL